MDRTSASWEVSLRRLALSSGIVLLVLGLGALAWGAVTWQWGDPVTALYTKRAQSRLADELEAKRHALLATAPTTAQPSAPTSTPGSAAGGRASIGPLARRYRATLVGETPLSRVKVPSGCVEIRAVDPRTGRERVESMQIRPNLVQIVSLNI